MSVVPFSDVVLRRGAVLLMPLWLVVLSSVVPSSRVWGQSPSGQKAKSSAPVGQLLLVRPALRLTEAGEKIGHDARSLDVLHVGDRLSVSAKGGATLVFYGTGARYEIVPKSEVLVQNGGLRVVKGPKSKALKPVSQDLLRPISNALNNKKPIGSQFGGQVLRSINGEKPPPHHYLKAVASPAFLPGSDAVVRWANGEMTGGTVAVSLFHVFEETGNKDGAALTTLSDVKTAAGAVRFPASRLLPGEKYRVEFADGPSPVSVEFRVLTEAEQDEVGTMRRETQAIKRTGEKDTSPELLLGLLFESHRLREEARTAYAEAVRRNPDDSGAARWLRTFAP